MNGGDNLRIRKLPLGDMNIIGARVTIARELNSIKQNKLLAKLHTRGINMSITALSLLEGQKRPVTDIELNALADILKVSVDWLLGREKAVTPLPCLGEGLRNPTLFRKVVAGFSVLDESEVKLILSFMDKMKTKRE